MDVGATLTRKPGADYTDRPARHQRVNCRRHPPSTVAFLRLSDRARNRHMKLDVIRVMDDEGRVIHPDLEPKLTGDELRKLLRTIIQIRILDERMLRLQR